MNDVLAWPLDSAAGESPAYTGRALRAASIAPLLAGASADRPLGTRSGVRPGTSPSTVSVSGRDWAVKPCAGVIDPHTSAAAGPYGWAILTEMSGTIDAAPGAFPRWDGLYVVVDDPAEGDGTSEPTGRVEYVAGPATSSQPVMPQAPERSLLLARIVVPVAGTGDPSVVWLASALAAAGAPLQVRSRDEANALVAVYRPTPQTPLWVEHIGDTNPRVGQVERHDGDRWSPPLNGGVITSDFVEAGSGAVSATETRLTGLEAHVDADGGAYFIDFFVHIQATVANDRVGLRIRRGTAVTAPLVGDDIFILGHAGVPVACFARTRDAPPKESVTYTVWLFRAGGTGTVQSVANENRPAVLTVAR